MGMDNKFVVLDKSKDKVESLKKFIEEIKESDANNTSDYRIATYEMQIKQYGNYWGLESEFRNTCLLDLEYWLKLKNKESIVKNSIIIINYDYSDYATMYNFLKDDTGENLFDIFDNIICEAGTIFKDEIPIDKLMEYFCIKL